MTKRKRIAVFASGNGSNYEAVTFDCETGIINGDVVLLIYDRRDAYVTKRANTHRTETKYMNKHMYGGDMEAFDKALLEVMQAYEIDLVVLAGYLSKIGPAMLKAYKNRIINTHPSLIPAFCGDGMYGEHVHEAVVDSGVKISGCTIHFVDSGMDTGPIILQQSVPVYFNEAVCDLAARVLAVEHKLLPEAVKLFCDDRLVAYGHHVEIL